MLGLWRCQQAQRKRSKAEDNKVRPGDGWQGRGGLHGQSVHLSRGPPALCSRPAKTLCTQMGDTTLAARAVGGTGMGATAPPPSPCHGIHGHPNHSARQQVVRNGVPLSIAANRRFPQLPLMTARHRLKRSRMLWVGAISKKNGRKRTPKLSSKMSPKPSIFVKQKKELHSIPKSSEVSKVLFLIHLTQEFLFCGTRSCMNFS